MSADRPSPSQLRAMFGANLRKLAAPHASISELSRQLGINRTQFNRYLAGESFPRPDVLSRVCSFFEVDARVLLEPVDTIGSGQDPIANPFLRDYLGAGAINVSTEQFPNGFYRFCRRSFVQSDVFIMSVVHVFRNGTNTFLRGFETRHAMRLQNLPTSSVAREYRGIVMQQDDGIVFIVSRKNAMTSSFNYIKRVASFDNNFWVGYITRTVPESADGLRVTRMTFEYLGTTAKDALPAARQTGFHSLEEVPAYHRRLLMTDQPFS
ncbi:MAG: helix-turn-helix transcriptional regulator [Sulfitobacter sp.]